MAKINGKVAQVLNEREVVLNRGLEQGVRVGMVVQVADPAVAVKDPDTGADLGTVRREKVKLKISRVEQKFAVARTFETYQINEGGTLSGLGFDLAQLRPQRIVTRVRTLRFDETGLDFSPLQPSESLVKIGDPFEEIDAGLDPARAPSFLRIEDLLTYAQIVPAPASGRWTASEILRFNIALGKALIGMEIELALVADKIDRAPDGRYKGLPRIGAPAKHDEMRNVKYSTWAYFGESESAVAQIRGLIPGTPITVHGTVARADLNGLGEVTLDLDLGESYLVG
jgi:hypothetical protein